MNKLCVVCGAEVSVAKRKYCSEKCAEKAVKQRRLEERNERRCIICDEACSPKWKANARRCPECITSGAGKARDTSINHDNLKRYVFTHAILTTYAIAEIREGLSAEQEAKKNRFWGNSKERMSLFRKKWLEVSEEYEKIKQ